MKKTGNGRHMRGQPVHVRLAEHTGETTSTGCILWIGAKNNHGYGRFTMNGKGILAHRASYEITHGKIPDGLFVLHKCDVPACINPDHLELGTQTDNMRQASQRQRVKVPRCKGEQQGSAKLTNEKVLMIRQEQGTHKSIAEKYGVSISVIYAVRNKKTWRHI
jgi:hypothetical protein